MVRTLLIALGLGVLPLQPLASGTVTGHGRFERVKGRPGLGYIELYESNLFLCPDGGTTRGPSYRLGAPPGLPATHDGFFSLAVPAGTWSLLVNQPLFFIRPKVLPGLAIQDGKTLTRNVELPIDYSTFFTDTWTGYDSVWVQTFAATGTSITGVSWKLAGTNATEVEASVLEDDGTPNPVLWPRISAAATKRDDVAAITDNWVRWRSLEVPTTPGKVYAVKLTGTAGGDRKFSVFKRDKDASSYAGGSAYGSGGQRQGFDLNVTVFSDSDGTAVLYTKTTVGLGELRDGNYAGRWGQTFKATTGTSLAAADVWAAGADSNWDLDFTFKVFETGPGGRQIGPAKTTRAAYQAFGAGLHGVSYNPGEVPLEAGKTYYIDFTNPIGFNPYVMEDPRDAYSGGAGYQSGSLRSTTDLSMTILVYTERGGTILGQVKDAVSGSGVPDATVTAVELGRSVSSGADGRYALLDVPAGTYSVRASKAGYGSQTRSGIAVAADGTAAVDFSLEPAPCSLELKNLSFESGLTGWTRFGDAKNRVVDTSGGEWFAGIRAYDGTRFHGNEVNAGLLPRGGLVQQACAVPGHRYRATVWSNIYWIGGVADDATSRIGIDPGGGTDPDGPVRWGAPHRQPTEKRQAWSKISVEAAATGPVLTILLELRQRNAATPPPGGQWRINCFDLVELLDLDAPAGPELRRGDCDSNGDGNIADAITLLLHLFAGGTNVKCADACDADDDGALGLADAISFLNYLFLGGRVPPAPGPHACGEDPTEDALGCEVPQC
ncbi:MAG: carboxypeptidase regulatory-like domain-containing protein [Planctomycetes bacterium]|nr:carboxypeptidase regulatory-like domain-containing protein [Planctomycetota bacterium]